MAESNETAQEKEEIAAEADDNEPEKCLPRPSTSQANPAVETCPETAKSKRPRSRPLRTASRPLLESVSESDSESSSSAVEKQPAVAAPQSDPSKKGRSLDDSVDDDRSGCPDYFGVRSYLHHFYETVNVKDPHLYEEFNRCRGGGGHGTDDSEDFFRFLMSRKRRRRKACSLWWKVGVWVGINLMLFGLIAILVGYLVPRREVVVGVQDDLEIIDRSAIKFNETLDLCKLVGLVVFCVGGGVVLLALLFPTLLGHQDDEVDFRPPPPPIQVLPKPTSALMKRRASTPATLIPATQEVSKIQPKQVKDDFVVTTGGFCSRP